MKVSRAVVAMVAACLIVGLSAFAPSAASAASGNDSAKAKQAQTPRTLNRRLNATRTQVATARRQLAAVRRDLAAITGRLRNSEGGLGTLLGAAPTLISSLQALGNAVQNQIGPGLTTLAAAVRDQIGPGLTRLGSAFQSVEYGEIGIARTDTGALVGPTAMSPDIPDDGNVAQAQAILPVIATGAMSLDLYATIRSAESDGDAADDPAGQVGGLLHAKCMTDLDPAPPNNGCAGGAIPAGGLACLAGPPPASTFSTPAGDKSRTLVTVPQRIDRTADNPGVVPGSAATVEATGPAQAGPPPVADECALPGSGIYEVVAQGQFVDIPKSASPGPTE